MHGVSIAQLPLWEQGVYLAGCWKVGQWIGVALGHIEKRFKH